MPEARGASMSHIVSLRIMDYETERRVQANVKPDTIGIKAIASELGIAVATVHRWRARGLPVVRWGGAAAGYSDRLRAYALRLR